MNFPNIEYTAGWYASRYPGFLTEEQYYILANWTKGVRNLEDIPEDELAEIEKIRIKESNDDNNNNNKKRKFEENEEGVEETKKNGICDVI